MQPRDLLKRYYLLNVEDLACPTASVTEIITGVVQAEVSTRVAVTMFPEIETLTREGLLDDTLYGWAPPETVSWIVVWVPKVTVSGAIARGDAEVRV